jgi:hypothetical protein
MSDKEVKADRHTIGIGNQINKKAENKISGSGRHERQCPGGNHDDTPGNVGKNNVDAYVLLTSTESGAKGIDSLGGSESRGRGNNKDGSGY